MAVKNNIKKVKAEIDARLASVYESVNIIDQPFFRKADGVSFRVVDLGGFRDALVIEYADTWEDGDLFYPADFKTLDEMCSAMIGEIES